MRTAAAATARGRLAAESLMVDTFTAYSESAATVDGLETVAWTDEGSTPGRVVGPNRDTDTRTVTVGGVEREVMHGGLHIPLSAPVPAIGWEFECTAVGAGSDPALEGRRWRVVDVPAKSFATARRLDVVEVP